MTGIQLAYEMKRNKFAFHVIKTSLFPAEMISNAVPSWEVSLKNLSRSCDVVATKCTLLVRTLPCNNQGSHRCLYSQTFWQLIFSSHCWPAVKLVNSVPSILSEGWNSTSISRFANDFNQKRKWQWGILPNKIKWKQTGFGSMKQ